ncbi:MAG TPA: hypothetical protein ENO21_03370 [Firmicutes bacterium]|nr:hypothetical protein [Bacillota bacterium]
MDRWIDEFAELPKEKQGRIGDYFVAKGVIDRYDLNWALRWSVQKNKPLGEVLVELNLATPLQIQQALEFQRDQEARRSKLYR